MQTTQDNISIFICALAFSWFWLDTKTNAYCGGASQLSCLCHAVLCLESCTSAMFKPFSFGLRYWLIWHPLNLISRFNVYLYEFGRRHNYFKLCKKMPNEKKPSWCQINFYDQRGKKASSKFRWVQSWFKPQLPPSSSEVIHNKKLCLWWTCLCKRLQQVRIKDFAQTTLQA